MKGIQAQSMDVSDTTVIIPVKGAIHDKNFRKVVNLFWGSKGKTLNFYRQPYCLPVIGQSRGHDTYTNSLSVTYFRCLLFVYLLGMRCTGFAVPSPGTFPWDTVRKAPHHR